MKPTTCLEMAVNRWLIASFVVLASFLTTLGQELNPQHLVSLSLKDATLQEALQSLDAMPDFTLSYNPGTLPEKSHITKKYVNQPIDEILKDLLGDDFEIKHIGRYVIIQKKEKKEKKNVTISGDIKDAKTGKTLKNVTVYEVNTLNSTLSDEEGQFKLKVKSKNEIATFAISRKDYQDTIIQVQDAPKLQQDIYLQPSKDAKPVNKERDLWLETKKLVKLFTSYNNRKNTENVDNIQDRYFQVSFVPSIGTNMSMGGQVRHKYSFNVLAGYSYGLDQGFELGGLYNIDRSDISGCQIGGIGNTVGGKTKGVQIGGVINVGRERLEGTQISGVTNWISDSVKGFQLAGFNNYSKGLNGAQVSGFTNIASTTDGFQLAGFSNHARDIEGMQLSSVINTARKINGVQLTAVINVAETTDGMQISSLLNTTKNLKGVQLGIINYADSISENALQIGFINLGRKNHLFEFGTEYSDVIPWRISLRTGTNKFYTAISAGTQFTERTESEALWSYGLGFGSKLFMTKKFFFNPEINCHNLLWHNDSDHESLNLLNKLHLNLGYQFFNHLSITGGPALNIYVTDYMNPQTGDLGMQIAKNTFYDQVEEENTRVQIWLGYQFAIRF
ncbi:carboxypeptidase-like regulatory domain-containing protein [Reichenbachiella ulvae]|uniref:Carboxypeptidase-like regulatory domain-containing protein n=1 Tax=Reichenbachiella ulvae TaxID=2980104 RepID=A0ABT3CRN0_9BACT|nr:carboxypeptidase-like regulatory domain-containing protein [Reichenbachiella ulvae]MCV9386337.1 carboxypeptidase-like regulatory domain-containing protein [Reichenbachiella ulvae]